MKKLTTAVVLAMAGTFFASADSYTLKKSDEDVYKDAEKVQQPNMSSFLSHPTYTKEDTDMTEYGWTNGNGDTDGTHDPSADHEYTVSGGKYLRTPYGANLEADTLAVTTNTFPGGKLILDNGYIAHRSCRSGASAAVCITNLLVKKGYFVNDSWANPNRWAGVYTFDGSDYDYTGSCFKINMSSCYIEAKLIAAAPNTIALTGTGLALSSGAFRSVTKYRTYKFYLQGDCSEYYATNLVQYGAIAYLKKADFAGSFDLATLGTLTLEDEADATVTIGGNVRGRDAALVVPEGKALTIAGDTDFGWADASTYCYGTSKLVSTNIYTKLPASEPYTPAHSATYANTEINVINVGEGSTLTLGDTTLSGTLLKFASGGRIDITGDLTLDANNPVEISLESGFDGILLSLPVSKRVLKVSDFTAAEGTRCLLSIETVNGVQYLRGCNYIGCTFNASTGYVTMKDNDNLSTSRYLSFGKKGVETGATTGCRWSNGELPFAGTNYFTNGKIIRAKTTQEFGGDRLVQNSYYFRVAYDTTITVADWVLLPNGSNDFATVTQIMPNDAKQGATTVNGKMKFFTTEESPFLFCGSQYSAFAWKVNADFVGDSQSGVLFSGQFGYEAGDNTHQSSLEYYGDASYYYGNVLINTNVICKIANGGFPNAKVRQTAYTELNTMLVDNHSEIAIGTYLPCGDSENKPKVVTAEGTTLAVGAMAASGAVVKEGAGTLAIGGAAGSNGATLEVAAGTLEPKSATAFEGMTVAFSAGTKLKLDLSGTSAIIACGLKADTVTIADTLEVEVTTDIVQDNLDLNIMTVNGSLSEAQALADKISIGKVGKRYSALSDKCVVRADPNEENCYHLVWQLARIPGFMLLIW